MPRVRILAYFATSTFAAVALLGCPSDSGRTIGEIGFFRGMPLDVEPGASVSLSWEASNATSCNLTPDVGEVSPVGAVVVMPQTTTSYSLDCNRTVAKVKIVVRPLLKIQEFTANPTSVAPDSPVTLRWSTTSASICSISPGLGEVPTNGTLEVSVPQTTTFTLQCRGTGPNQSATAIVTAAPVTSIQAPTDVTLTPKDGTLEVKWRQTVGAGIVYFAEAAGITKANIDTLPGRVIFRKVLSPFRITGLKNGQRYYVRLSAVSGAIESDLSQEVSAAPAGAANLSDPLFPQQWHLFNAEHEDVNVSDVWASGNKGEGIRVAIVDEGIDLEHEDLQANVETNASHDYIGRAPVRLARHGTCVAGLVAARDLNGLGVRGVAPRALLRSYNVLTDLTSANQYDAMIRDMASVHISNNSWGDASDGTGLLTFADPIWLRGAREGATIGRGGKGVLYFWAAGNGGEIFNGVFDDSNFDAQAASRFVYAIGAVGRDGKKPLYAEAGANVLVVAPTEGEDQRALVTTDVTATAGYNTGREDGELSDLSYSNQMNGTSGSTPIAAGVGALVLAARPELSYRDVRRVLALSARKTDPTSIGWDTNRAGLHVHHSYGFGVVDAKAAVALARTIPLVGPELSAQQAASPNVPIPDATTEGVSSSVTIAGSGIGHIEAIEIEVTAAHPHSGDLEILLSRNNSVNDLLHPAHDCVSSSGSTDCADLKRFVFLTVRHLDEPADGVWTLLVRDRKTSQTGTLAEWKLRIYGRQ